MIVEKCDKLNNDDFFVCEETYCVVLCNKENKKEAFNKAITGLSDKIKTFSKSDHHQKYCQLIHHHNLLRQANPIRRH